MITGTKELKSTMVINIKIFYNKNFLSLYGKTDHNVTIDILRNSYQFKVLKLPWFFRAIYRL